MESISKAIKEVNKKQKKHDEMFEMQNYHFKQLFSQISSIPGAKEIDGS